MLKIKVKRGPSTRLPLWADEGEFIFSEDTKELFLGQGSSLPLIKVGIIDDATASTLFTWSGSKISSEILALIKDTSASGTTTYSSNKIVSLLSDFISDGSISAGKTWSGYYLNNLVNTINSSISGIVNDALTNLTNTWSSSKLNSLFTNRTQIHSNVVAINTSTQSITGGAYTKVTFPTISVDSNSEFTNSAFTSKTNQTVLVSAGVSISASIANGNQVFVYIYKNGVVVPQAFTYAVTASNKGNPFISIPIDLNVNDVIEIYCRHTNATNVRSLDGTQFLRIHQLY